MPTSPREPSHGGNRRRPLILSLLYLASVTTAVGVSYRVLIEGDRAEAAGGDLFLAIILLLLMLSTLLIFALLAHLPRSRPGPTGSAATAELEQQEPVSETRSAGPVPQPATDRPSHSGAAYQNLELEALRLLRSDQPIDRITQGLLRLLSDRLGFALAELWVADERGERLELVDHWRSLSLRARDLLARHQALFLGVGEGLPGRIWAQGKTRREYDLSSREPGQWLGEGGRLGLRSAIGVPLAERGSDARALGALVFCSTSAKQYDPIVRRLLTDLGRELGSLITRSREYSVLQRDEHRYRSVVEQAIGPIGVGLLVLDRREAVVWASATWLACFGLADQQVIGVNARELYSRARTDGEDGTAEFIEALLASHDDRSELEGYEIHLHGSNGRPERWLEYWSQPIPEGLYKGGRVEYCLDITRRKRDQADARHLAQQQASVADLGRRALAELDLKTLVAESVQVLARDLEVGFSGWFEVSPDGQHLMLKAGVGWDQDDPEQVSLPAEVDTHLGYSLFSSGPVIVEDFTQETRFPHSPWLAEYNIRSGLGVALQVRGRSLGVLAAYSVDARPYSEDDVTFARSLAVVLGNAIERAQSEETLRRAGEELELRVQVRTHELSSAIQALQAEVAERQRAEDGARRMLLISQQLTRTLDPDELLDELVRESMRLVGARGGCAGLKAEGGLAIRKVFSGGREVEAEYVWPPGVGLAGWLLDHRKLYVAPNARIDPQIDPVFRDRFGIRSVICLPIMDSQEQVIGFFELHNAQSEGAWSAVDQERLETVASMASIAIQNALAYRKLQQAEAELSSSKTQLEEAQRIAQIGNWDWDIQSDVLSWSDELFLICGLDPAKDTINFDKFMELVHPEDRRWLRRRFEQAYRDHQPFSFEHRIQIPQGALKVIHGLAKVIVDPSGRTIRMVGTGQDVTSAKEMAEALSGQSRLYESLLEAQSDLGLGVIVTQDRRIVYANDALAQICGYTPSELEHFGDVLELMETSQRAAVEAYMRAAAEGNAPQHCDTVIRHKNGEHRNIEISVKVTDTSVGKREFTLVRDVSQQVKAMQRLRDSEELLRRLSAHLQEAREQERATIAREIHDELGQSLTGLKMDVAWIEQRVAKGEDGPTRQRLLDKARGMSDLIDVTIQAVRRIATELRPGMLDDLGLIPAIEWQVGEFAKRTGIECNLLTDIEDLELDRSVATGAFRILQEALTNVARHSQATRVDVRLQIHDGSFHLVVEDNGVGLRGEATGDGSSLGILGMQERAHLLGGEVWVEGGPRKGTRVRVRLPLRHARQPERVMP